MKDQTTKQLSSDDTKSLNSSSQTALPPSDDLKLQALNQQPQDDDDVAVPFSPMPTGGDGDELATSDQLAETLTSLQNVIERSAQQLEKLKKELKEKREMLSGIFENDTQLSEAQNQLATYTSEVKDRKSKLQADPQVTALKVQIGEINEQKKELEEGLSNHLVNYYSLTNSKSFDTSDGDQWDFEVRAKVKSRPKKKDD